MPSFAALEMFVSVADEQSFTRAAALKDTSRTMASRYVSDLEAELGTRLFDRTTRSVRLTEAGHAYLTRARVVLETLQLANDEASRFSDTPTGKLRISAPLTFGSRYLAPILAEFRRHFPEVEIDVFLSDRTVDLIEEGFDLALRIGNLQDSTLKARKLVTIRRSLVASADYLKSAGEPLQPGGLKAHQCLGYHYANDGSEWQVQTVADGATKTSVRVRGAISSNNGDVNLQLAEQGCGIANLPVFITHQHIAQGKLVRVLPAYEPPPIGLYVIFPPGAHQPLKMRRFVDHVAYWFRNQTPWNHDNLEP